MYPVDGDCVFLKLPISLLVNANGGRHIAATSEYKSSVCAAVYLFKFQCKIHTKVLQNKSISKILKIIIITISFIILV